MFYDLNLPYINGDQDLPRKLHFLHELGYNVVALNHSIFGKLPTDVVSTVSSSSRPFVDCEQTCAIPEPSQLKDVPVKMQLRRRVTVTLTDTMHNARLSAVAQQYDILALRPVDERTLRLALDSYDCDIVSLDMSQRLGFHFKMKMFGEAIKTGKRVEICYGQAVMGDASTRRNLISNATQLIRATRGRGLIISSEAKSVLACRGPWDVVNLAAVWGLGQERGHEAVSKEARGIVARAQLKRTSYRGVINVVYGGEPASAKPTANGSAEQKQEVGNNKRKADVLGDNKVTAEKPLSKTQQKKRARLAAQAAKVSIANEQNDKPDAVE